MKIFQFKKIQSKDLKVLNWDETTLLFKLSIKRIFENFFTYLIIIFTVLIVIFSNWESSHETWGYWYFARVFTETGRFVIIDRSPLYIIYLNLFSWLPYPNSVNVEYLITTCITVFALVAFFKSYLGVQFALFASCLWIPYLQAAEPPVQKLALAASLVAVLIRKNKDEKFYIVLSYMLLIFAYLFRQTYLLLLLMFLAYDIFSSMRFNGTRNLFSWRAKLLDYWPIILVMILFFWFVTTQSPSHWNNVWFTNTEWFPSNGKTMMDGGGVQARNGIYIFLKYGSFEGHDFYFTNQEVFNGETSFIGAMFANPTVFLQTLIFNFSNLIPQMMERIWLPKTNIILIDYINKSILLVGIIYGAFRMARDWPTKILVFGNLALVGATVLALPKWRYMMPMIPIFILAAYWYGTKVRAIFTKTYLSPQNLIEKMMLLFICLGVLLFILFLSEGNESKSLRSMVFLACTVLFFAVAIILLIVTRVAIPGFSEKIVRLTLALPIVFIIIMFANANLLIWAEITRNIVSGVGRGQSQLLVSKNTSLKKAFPQLAQITQNCKGIMSLEATFVGAFLPIPQRSVYAPWEIPPFGQLDNSPYKGLNPDRIDCILVSYEFASEVGEATNIQIRYQNYIKPYLNNLISLGAVTYNVPNFGQAFILHR